MARKTKIEEEISELEVDEEISENGAAEEGTITPKQLAQSLGTDARTVRKFLRSDKGKGFKVGQGNRWHLEEDEVPELVQAWHSWRKGSGPKAKTAEVVEPSTDDLEDEELLELEDV